MSDRDLENKISLAQSLQPAARTSSVNGSTVDLQGYGSATILVSFGAWTDGTHTPSLQHSDDGSTWTTCDSNSLNGTFAAVSSSGGNGTVQKIGYTGGKRYLRTVMTVASASTGALSAAGIVRGNPAHAPV